VAAAAVGSKVMHGRGSRRRRMGKVLKLALMLLLTKDPRTPRGDEFGLPSKTWDYF
jgi:hypothetical protein